MAENWVVFAEGLSDLAGLEPLEGRIQSSLVRAVNKAIRDGRVEGARAIRDQVNLPARYVSPGSGNFTTRPATGSNPEGAIVAAGKRVSLSRYVTNKPRPGQPVRVEVQPGKARYMKGAFLMKLPAGSAPVETRYNLGLAVRLSPGERLRNKRASVRLANNLYLLYGPSVDQVFIDSRGEGVAEQISPFVAAKMEDEFFRLVEL